MQGDNNKNPEEENLNDQKQQQGNQNQQENDVFLDADPNNNDDNLSFKSYEEKQDQQEKKFVDFEGFAKNLAEQKKNEQVQEKTQDNRKWYNKLGDKAKEKAKGAVVAAKDGLKKGLGLAVKKIKDSDIYKDLSSPSTTDKIVGTLKFLGRIAGIALAATAAVGAGLTGWPVLLPVAVGYFGARAVEKYAAKRLPITNNDKLKRQNKYNINKLIEKKINREPDLSPNLAVKEIVDNAKFKKGELEKQLKEQNSFGSWLKACIPPLILLTVPYKMYKISSIKRELKTKRRIISNSQNWQPEDYKEYLANKNKTVDQNKGIENKQQPQVDVKQNQLDNNSQFRQDNDVKKPKSVEEKIEKIFSKFTPQEAKQIVNGLTKKLENTGKQDTQNKVEQVKGVQILSSNKSQKQGQYGKSSECLW